jgi:hypothetical protein
MQEYVSAKTLFDDLEKVDYLEYGNIPLPWKQYVAECENTVKQNPNYNVSPFDGEVWQEGAKKMFSIVDTWKDWGYTSHNTKIWKTTNQKPKIDFVWEKDIANHLPFSDCIVTPTMQSPGHTLPWHEDNFVLLKQKYPTGHLVRFLIFMEDSSIGHALQIKDSWKTKWKAGDVIVWYPSAGHLSINIGNKNKWTCNVTGLLK